MGQRPLNRPVGGVIRRWIGGWGYKRVKVTEEKGRAYRRWQESSDASE